MASSSSSSVIASLLLDRQKVCDASDSHKESGVDRSIVLCVRLFHRMMVAGKKLLCMVRVDTLRRCYKVFQFRSWSMVDTLLVVEYR
ncbi:hypothetical protein DPMN_030615 [Dreissena polymorpha]|uniref:Uncharacterized protein n=1 Tax=Dreissena polymorpha TaxID=45954 RepID=A0A9D4LYG8_DREPO|nr:hypothetical protein DPMN_030615 [Dreissena polymorpha]